MTTAHQIFIRFMFGFSCLGFLSNYLKKDKGLENEMYEPNRSDDMRKIRELVEEKCRRLFSSGSFGNEAPEILEEDFFQISCRCAPKNSFDVALEEESMLAEQAKLLQKCQNE